MPEGVFIIIRKFIFLGDIFGLNLDPKPWSASGKVWIVWFPSLWFLIDWVNPWWCVFFFFNFFKFPEFFLFLGHFWAPYTQTLVQNLQGAPQKGWVVQFLATFLIHVERFQAKFSWGFALILFDFCEKISQK